MLNVRPIKVTRRTVQTSSPKKTSAEDEYEFENLGNTTCAGTEDVIDFVHDACATIETMVNSSPAKVGEVDGVQIMGYMDGIRVFNRLKKKLDDDVEYYCTSSRTSQVLSPNDGACACQGLCEHVDLSYVLENEASQNGSNM